MGNVVSLQAWRAIKEQPEYKAKIEQMDKCQLLEEMVSYQEERAKMPQLTAEMITRGLILFSQIYKTAETVELKTLCKGYHAHLKAEAPKYGLKIGV